MSKSALSKSALAKSGICFKGQHFQEVLQALPGIGFFEVHAENYFGAGGPPHRALSEIRSHYDLSVHGVGASLGAAGPLDGDHLAALKQVVDRYQPFLVSEHIAWCGQGGRFLNDLLPLPYTEESLTQLADHIDQTQEALGRQILIENPSTYLMPAGSDRTEPAFLADVCGRTGCGLLLDVNNIYVSARNNGWDASAYIEAVPKDAVGEIHLAGHLEDSRGGIEILVDDHGSEVCQAVWDLYTHALKRFGPVPTLIEWDTRVPALDTLLAEAAKADALRETVLARTDGVLAHA